MAGTHTAPPGTPGQGCRNVVVVGGGPTDHHFVETLYRRDDRARYRVTLLGEEDMAPCDRVQLAKRWDKSCDLTLGDPTLRNDGRIELVLGDRATNWHGSATSRWASAAAW